MDNEANEDMSSGPKRSVWKPKTFYPPPAPKQKTAQETQDDAESRSALHEHIEAAMRNDQTLLDASTTYPEGTDAETIAEALEEASEGAKPKSIKKKKGKKGKMCELLWMLSRE
jgi:hypothetical protein